MGEYLYRIDPALGSLLLIGVLFAASEAGYWLVRKRMEHESELVKKEDVALFLGAVLTLLALLLGFTYSMSMNRFDTRRALAVDEANAIGTTYLRAQTLPEPWSSEAQGFASPIHGIPSGDCEATGANTGKSPASWMRKQKSFTMRFGRELRHWSRRFPAPSLDSIL